MAVDRAALLTTLTYRYPTLLADSGVALTDTVDGLGPILDQVTAIADGDATLDDATLTDIARYLALELICERLAAQFDLSSGGDSYKLSQEFTNAKALRDSVKASVEWALGGLVSNGAGQEITVSFPFLSDGVLTW